MQKIQSYWKEYGPLLPLLIGGSAILAFGLYNIHSQSGVTEGGVLGALLLIEHWLPISPAISSVILNVFCYGFGLRHLGKRFAVCSILATGSFTLFYAILEQFPPLMPSLADYPLAASVLGGCFVGVGVGMAVRAGSASSGDDALAMAISKISGIRISRIYFLSDFIILLLSLSYIPFRRIFFSLLTVTLSSFIIERFQRKALPIQSET
ncbi:MAG: YitT family protein [Candidatus Merdivicinus sp.]|jgi:uncharacterized membrane-anchored protein YitT (DUF2179 family)